MLAERNTVVVDHSVGLLDRLRSARRVTDELFAVVPDRFLYERPIPERHRIVFYIGHLEAFDWNLLRERLINDKAFDQRLDRLFAFGIARDTAHNNQNGSSGYHKSPSGYLGLHMHAGLEGSFDVNFQTRLFRGSAG